MKVFNYFGKKVKTDMEAVEVDESIVLATDIYSQETSVTKIILDGTAACEYAEMPKEEYR